MTDEEMRAEGRELWAESPKTSAVRPTGGDFIRVFA